MSPEFALYVALGKSAHGNEDEARALLARGVKATFRQAAEGGWTTRMQCFYYRRHLVSLLRGHPHVNVSDAAIDGDVEAVARFLDGGASPDEVDCYGQNWPLRYAACAGHLDVVELLLAHGARVGPENARPWDNPLVAALIGGHTDIADVLWASGARVVPSEGGACWRLLDYVVKDRAPDVSLAWVLAHEPESDLAVALHTAVHYGLPGSVAYLLTHGADVDAVRGARTPLMTAAFQKELEKVRILVDAGANVHATDPRGYTAMHYAISAGHIDDPDDGPFHYYPEVLDHPVARLLRATGLAVPPGEVGGG
jgi:hypothetical protein